MLSTISFLFLSLLTGGFLLMPRSVALGLGNAQFTPRDWHRNKTEGTYQLTLGVALPVSNLNYYKVCRPLLPRDALCPAHVL